MRLTTLLLFCMAAFAVNAPSVQGLAFVASTMRVPTVGPVAALKFLGRRGRNQPSSPVDGSATVLSAQADVLATKETYKFGADDDASVKAMRNEMVDIVYQRSMQRLDGFATQ